MEQYALYLVLKEIAKTINSNYIYTFNDMDSNKSNVVGIYIKGGENSKYRTLAKGQYLNYINRVQFLVQAGDDDDSYMNMLSFASRIRDALIIASNTYITVPSKIGIDSGGNIVKHKEGLILSEVVVMISKIDKLGDPVSLGKSGQDKAKYSINLTINYGLGGN